MRAPRKDISFSATEKVIVKSGEEITNKHISQVQDVVKHYLEELENETKDVKQREIDHINLNIASTRAEADMAITEVRAHMEEELAAVRAEKKASVMNCWTCVR